MKASIAIAGGGIIGLSIAWRLAQRGFAVTVFEKGTVGREASWAGAGMLAPGGEVDEASDLGSMAMESRALYPAFVAELERDSGLAIDFQSLGALDLAYSGEERDALEARAARQLAIGIASKALDVKRVAALWPRIRMDGLAGARFYPDDAVVNPREVVLALCAVCRKLGVRVLQNRALGSNEEEEHGAVVIAAGAWSGSIFPGLPPSMPVKGHLLGYQQPEQTCHTIVRHGASYLLQRASGLLIAGASTEQVGFDRAIDSAVVNKLAQAAGFVMPHLSETTPTEVWNGFRPGSDGLHIGRWQNSNIYLAYGHYRNGILLAPLTAARLAAEISANWGTR